MAHAQLYYQIHFFQNEQESNTFERLVIYYYTYSNIIIIIVLQILHSSTIERHDCLYFSINNSYQLVAQYPQVYCRLPQNYIEEIQIRY
jgi:hypothetical protein